MNVASVKTMEQGKKTWLQLITLHKFLATSNNIFYSLNYDVNVDLLKRRVYIL